MKRAYSNMVVVKNSDTSFCCCRLYGGGELPA